MVLRFHLNPARVHQGLVELFGVSHQERVVVHSLLVLNHEEVVVVFHLILVGVAENEERLEYF